MLANLLAIKRTSGDANSRGRLWISRSLNDNSTHEYLSALFWNEQITHEYYLPDATIRREEYRSALLMLLESLSAVSFDLRFPNSMDLDDDAFWRKIKLYVSYARV